jgi:hypothetical protein
VKGLAAILTVFYNVADECSHVERDACPKSKRSLDFSSPKVLPPTLSTDPAVQVMGDVELQLPNVRIISVSVSGSGRQ